MKTASNCKHNNTAIPEIFSRSIMPLNFCTCELYFEGNTSFMQSGSSKSNQNILSVFALLVDLLPVNNLVFGYSIIVRLSRLSKFLTN